MQDKRPTFNFQTGEKKCLLSELMIYLVPNGSELGTKGVWELNKHRLSLRASSTSKGKAQKQSALVCCPRAAQLTLEGSSAPPEHIPESLWHWGKGQKKWCNRANCVIGWAAQKPKCFWNDWVSISQFHCSPSPLQVFLQLGRAGREREVLRNRNCAQVFKPFPSLDKLFEVISHPHKHFPTSCINSNGENPRAQPRLPNFWPITQGVRRFVPGKGSSSFLLCLLCRAGPDSHFTQQGGGAASENTATFFLQPRYLQPCHSQSRPTHSSTGTNIPSHREHRGGFTFPLQHRLIPGKSQQHV